MFSNKNLPTGRPEACGGGSFFNNLKLSAYNLHLNFDADTGRKIQMLKRVDGFVRWADNVDQPLVSEDGKLFATVFIGVR